ncbi:hypothetical protein QBC44DRAFT_395531 [Cladorrhinum sp. PSN332]|nr:hypothetical protein QBC44DRAFT_395531 [Cladorrhinum sp. PSN332]
MDSPKKASYGRSVTKKKGKQTGPSTTISEWPLLSPTGFSEMSTFDTPPFLPSPPSPAAKTPTWLAPLSTSSWRSNGPAVPESRTQRLRADTADTVNLSLRDSTAGVIPIALSNSLSPSSSSNGSPYSAKKKLPQTPQEEGYFNLVLPKTTYTPITSSSSSGQSPRRDPTQRAPVPPPKDLPPTPSIHESMLPQPLAVGPQTGRSARQQKKAAAAAAAAAVVPTKDGEPGGGGVVSGWWGPLASFISSKQQPKGEYDPSNVV